MTILWKICTHSEKKSRLNTICFLKICEISFKIFKLPYIEILKIFLYIRSEVFRKILPLRGSHLRCSIKISFLKNFAKFIGKHLCRGIFFNKVPSLRPPTLSKKRLRHRCFRVNFAKFLKKTFLLDTFGWILLSLAFCHLCAFTTS